MVLCAILISMLAFTAAAFAEDTVTVPIKKTGYESHLWKTYTLDKANASRVIPLKVNSAGTVQVNLKVKTIERYMDAGVYTDSACTNRLSGFYGYLQTGDTSTSGYVSVSKAGTYYLKLDCYYYSSMGNFTNTIDVGVGEYTKADKVFTAKTTKIRYYRKNSKDVYRFKYKAPKTGKVFFKVNSPYGAYVRLEDGKKKALNSSFAWVSSGSDLHKGKIGYAVKKGKVYYFAVKTIASDEIQVATISKVTTVKEKSGANKKKAKKIKAKKKANGLLLAGENKADWYKFSIMSRKKVTITVTGEPNTDNNYKDGFLVTVYDKKGKKIGSMKMKNRKAVGKLTNSTKYGYADKGTYYIKISPLTKKKSSGYYTLSWK